MISKRRKPPRKRKPRYKPLSGRDQRWVYIMQREKKRKTEITLRDIIPALIAIGLGLYFYDWTVTGLVTVGLVAIFFSVISRQTEYKIGIAKNPSWRHHDVNRDVPGKVKIVRARFVSNARSLENRLHYIFSDSRFTMKNAGKSAGKTEWFYMTFIEYATLEYLLFYYSAESKVSQYIILVTAALISFIYIYTQLIIN